VQVLRLLETFALAEVSAAVRQALLLPAISFDAVKHPVLCAIERRPPKLDLENYPTCRSPRWRWPTLPTMLRCCPRTACNGHAAGVAGALPEAAEAADHAA